MSSKSNYFENLQLKAFFQNDTASKAEIAAASLELRLYSADLTESSENGSTNQVTISGYSALPWATWAAAFGTPPSGGQIVNDGVINFPTFNGSGAIEAIAVVDATANKIWYYKTFTSTINVSVNTVLRIDTGTWTVQES